MTPSPTFQPISQTFTQFYCLFSAATTIEEMVALSAVMSPYNNKLLKQYDNLYIINTTNFW